MKPVKDRIEFENEFIKIRRDFSLYFAAKPKIFMLNSSRHTHGIAEPNLSIAAYRASQVVNSLLQEEKYVTPQEDMFQDFFYSSFQKEKVARNFE